MGPRRHVGARRPGDPGDQARGDHHDGPGPVAGQPRQPPVRRSDGLRGLQRRGRPVGVPVAAQRRGLKAWSPSKLLLGSARGYREAGADLSHVLRARPAPARTSTASGAGGRRSATARPGPQVEREAQREYASQGWAVFPDVSTDPNQLGCDYFTQVRRACRSCGETSRQRPRAPRSPARCSRAQGR